MILAAGVFAVNLVVVEQETKLVNVTTQNHNIVAKIVLEMLLKEKIVTAVHVRVSP